MAREKYHVTFEGAMADFSAETLEARIFKALKKICQLSENILKREGKIKAFSDRQKLKELSTSRPVLQKYLRKYFSPKENDPRW